MSVTAKFYVSVNGGANQEGGVEVPSAATIQFVPQSTVGWLRARWEIYDYPEGWATPAGWSLDGATGTIYSLAINPPLITLPASSVLWGVWMPRVLVNEQIDDDQNILDGLYDDTTAWSMLSTVGLRDMGAREKAHFTTTVTRVKNWIRSYQRNLRTIDAIASALAGSGITLVNTGTGTLSDIVSQSAGVNATVIVFTGAGDKTLTGIASPATSRVIALKNAGSGTLTIAHDTTSTAANRTMTQLGGNVVLAAGASGWVFYNSNASRWEFVGVASDFGAQDITTTGKHRRTGSLVKLDSDGSNCYLGGSNVFNQQFPNTYMQATTNGRFVIGISEQGLFNASYWHLYTPLRLGGAGTYPSAGELQFKDGASIKYVVGGIDRNVCLMSGGNLIFGGFVDQCAGQLFRCHTGGTFFFQVESTNQLTISAASILTGAPVGGNNFNTVPFRWMSVDLTQVNTSDVTLTSTQYECPIVKVSGTPGGDFANIVPNSAGSFFVIRQFTPNYMTWKKSGGTGVVCPPRKTLTVVHDGSDYIRVSQYPAGANGFRITASSGNPIPTSDVATTTSIYLTPYEHGTIALVDPFSLIWIDMDSDEVSLALGTLVADKLYDVFAYLNSSGRVAIELGAAWTNDTTRATALVRQNGVLCKSGDVTRRYVGTIRTISTTQTTDTQTQRFVYNEYNQVERHAVYYDATANWVYGSTTVRQANGAGASRVEYVVGNARPVQAEVHTRGTASAAGLAIVSGIGLDSTTVSQTAAQGAHGIWGGSSTAFASETIWSEMEWNNVLAPGYHAINWLESISAASNITIYGDTAGSKSHIRARVCM